MGIKDTGYEDVDWIPLVRERPSLANTSFQIEIQ
jgi:hypothetical protein